MKRPIALFLAAAAAISGFILLNSQSIKNSQSPLGSDFSLAPEVLAGRFEYLSAQRTNACFGDKSYVAQLSEDGTRLRGSCCSPMDLHSYQEQIQGLQKYSGYDIIPKDPYDVSANWADEMMQYNEETELNEEQQAIYDEAAKMSHEGGPCCCLCWRWYAYGGLAKYLIVNYDFSSDQIAEVWDLSDGCGGEHHHH